MSFMEELKIGDLVRFPNVPGCSWWWQNQIGVVDVVEPENSGNVKYRAFISTSGPNTHVRFGDPDFVEVLNESR